MDMCFRSMEKSVKDKYHELNDRLIDIKDEQSYYFFKLKEYLIETRHGNLPLPSPIKRHHQDPFQQSQHPSSQITS